MTCSTYDKCFIIYYYEWNGSAYNTTADGSLELPIFDKITKNIKIEWRVRHTGRNRYKKARNRRRYHVNLSISGLIPKTLIPNLEYLAGQNLKVRLEWNSLTELDEADDTYGSTNGFTSYYVITGLQLMSGKFPDYVRYTLSLERVNPPPNP